MSRAVVRCRWVLATVGGLLVLCLLFLGLRQADAPSLRLSRPGSRHTSDGSVGQIANATLGFQKIFVISLPSRSDHRDAVSLAAHFTGLQIDYVDGVTNVDMRTLPPGGEEFKYKPGVVGSWRAHMNVLRNMIEQNITSALVLEDDTDWDLRIKSQMRNFAQASRLLLQLAPGTTDRYLDPTYSGLREGNEAQDFDVAKEVTAEPISSPYGDIDRWDLLWLGHCGAHFPRASDNMPLGRAVIFDDQTVPEKQHVDEQYGDKQLVQGYPDHTRAASRARMNTCTLAYGISLPGARRFLYELAMRKMTRAADIMFRDMCDGTDDRPMRTCLSVQPQLFQHHRPIAAKSSFSDIGASLNGAAKADAKAEYTTAAFTRNIRWSTRVNFPQLVDGSLNYTDWWQDGQPRPALGYG